jgi:hypothetical protein
MTPTDALTRAKAAGVAARNTLAGATAVRRTASLKYRAGVTVCHRLQTCREGHTPDRQPRHTPCPRYHSLIATPLKEVTPIAAEVAASVRPPNLSIEKTATCAPSLAA